MSTATTRSGSLASNAHPAIPARRSDRASASKVPRASPPSSDASDGEAPRRPIRTVPVVRGTSHSACVRRAPRSGSRGGCKAVDGAARGVVGELPGEAAQEMATSFWPGSTVRSKRAPSLSTRARGRGVHPAVAETKAPARTLEGLGRRESCLDAMIDPALGRRSQRPTSGGRRPIARDDSEDRARRRSGELAKDLDSDAPPKRLTCTRARPVDPCAGTRRSERDGRSQPRTEGASRRRCSYLFEPVPVDGRLGVDRSAFGLDVDAEEDRQPARG